MSRRTFTNFDTELSLRLANRTDITSAIRGFLLNDAMFKLGKHYEHSQLQVYEDETQLISTDYFDITAANLWWVEWIRNTTDNRPVTIGDLNKLEALAKRTGPPFQYHCRGSRIFTDTIADTAKTMRVFYIKKPAQWSAGEAPFDEDFDMLILLWAHKLGLESVRDFEAADAVGKQIGMYVSGMKFSVRQQKLNDENAGMRVRNK